MLHKRKVKKFEISNTLSVSSRKKTADAFSMQASLETFSSSFRSTQISTNSSFDIPNPSPISLKTCHKVDIAALDTTKRRTNKKESAKICKTSHFGLQFVNG